ncbi:MAG: hypothetical protein EU536_00530 [Promethearchaeota archaeon]|nr:MAG: hypothetical protein EU536_00530 [Candidatus Lokiarchaeota archaeon]
MTEQTIFCSKGLIGPNLEPRNNVVLTISDGRIQEIETDSSQKSADLKYPDQLMVPGFINAHVHIGDSFAKDQGLNLTIQELVEPPNGLKHRLLNDVSDDLIIIGIKQSIQEMISSGTTTFVDFRESGEKGIAVLKNALMHLPIRAIICGRPFPKMTSLESVLDVSDGIGLSSSNNYSNAELIKIKTSCNNLKKFICAHVSETQEERLMAFKKFGTSDVIRALNVLGVDILIHLTWADPSDVQEIAERGKSVVICPRSNAHLNVGFPPLNLLMKKTILTCLGTDNVMINNLNLFREMEFLFKTTRKEFGIGLLSSFDILKMVTINPAKALKLNDEIGSLELNKRADFFLMDLKAPNLTPFNSVHDALVLRANPQNIKAVFIGGNIAYEQ